MKRRTKIIIALSLICFVGIVGLVLGLTLGGSETPPPPPPPPPPPAPTLSPPDMDVNDYLNQSRLPADNPVVITSLQTHNLPSKFIVPDDCILKDGDLQLQGIKKGDYCFFEGIKVNNIDEHGWNPETGETFPVTNITDLETACSRRAEACIGYDSDMTMLRWTPSIDYWYTKWPENKDTGTFIKIGNKIDLSLANKRCITPPDKSHYTTEFCFHSKIIPGKTFLNEKIPQKEKCEDEICQIQHYEQMCKDNPNCFAFTTSGVMYTDPRSFQSRQYANVNKWESIRKYIPESSRLDYRQHGTFVNRNYQGSTMDKKGGLFDYMFS